MGSELAGVCAQTQPVKGLWEGGWQSGRAGEDPTEMPASPHLRLRTMPWGRACSRLALSKPKAS